MEVRGYILFFTVILAGCTTEFVHHGNRPTNAHDAYLASLEKAGLGSTLLVKKWREASHSVLESPLTIPTPYRETGFFDPLEPDAVGYSFQVVRGRRIIIEFLTQELDAPGLYADLFRMEEGRNNEPGQPVHIASRNNMFNKIEFEPRKDGRYLFRLQPELLKGGRFSITVLDEPALEFPVKGSSVKSIISGFGDLHDGGRSQHEGLDIKAERGTPVLAPARAFVSFAGSSEPGGNIVWLQDEDRMLKLYFAHLETQTVRTGTWVNSGDMIGTVGNTGNASASPYHLHFGVYTPVGPIDPRAFIQPGAVLSAAEVKIASFLGAWARTKKNIVGPTVVQTSESGPFLSVPGGVPVRIKGEAGELARVMLPDGKGGYIRSDSIESIDPPLEKRYFARPAILRAAPFQDAGEKGAVPAGGELLVLGSYEGYLFVRTHQGMNAWTMLGAL